MKINILADINIESVHLSRPVTFLNEQYNVNETIPREKILLAISKNTPIYFDFFNKKLFVKTWDGGLEIAKLVSCRFETSLK